MSDRERTAGLYDEGHEPSHLTRRQKVEALIDDMGAQSFPASDPPTWGVAASRLEQAETEREPG
jgi:hypothetical protein